MTVTTLLRYLFGDREAIRAIAASRHALWVGLLFVLSAGLAREYDGEDLLHQPWYAVIPVGASLASSFVLFTVVYGIACGKGEPGHLFFHRYLSFLGLFWLTAPLAWLYAVPYEHLLSPADAMRANLITLGVVSVWRIFLMVRVLMALLSYSAPAAVCIVLFFADVVALGLLYVLPVPLIDVMGGLRLSERDEVLRRVACGVFQLGGCSFPFLALGALIWAITSRPRWALEDGLTPPRPSAVLQALAVGSVLVWAAVLPFTQPKQVRRWQVEQAFRQGNVEDALREMSRHERSDFPPGWEPPPRQAILFHADNLLLRVLDLLSRDEWAEWVREVYLDKTAQILGGLYLDEDKLWHIAATLRRIPGGIEVIDRMKDQELARQLRKVMENRVEDPAGKGAAEKR